MAAPLNSILRVRLFFDYPPPATPGCRMNWLLVDMNRCRVVADLASIIRDKFEFSRGTLLSLFIDECFLPPSESACLVRDNDSIRVKTECVLPELNGLESKNESLVSHWKNKKRFRTEDEPLPKADINSHTKKKKKRKQQQETPSPSPQQEVESLPDCSRKKKERKKKESASEESEVQLKQKKKDKVYKDDLVISNKDKKNKCKTLPVFYGLKPPKLSSVFKKTSVKQTAQSDSESSTSSDTTEDELPPAATSLKRFKGQPLSGLGDGTVNKAATSKQASSTFKPGVTREGRQSSDLATAKQTQKVAASSGTKHVATSQAKSSSSDSSSEDTEMATKKPAVEQIQKMAAASSGIKPAATSQTKSSSSDSSSEDTEMATKKPALEKMQKMAAASSGMKPAATSSSNSNSKDTEMVTKKLVPTLGPSLPGVGRSIPLNIGRGSGRFDNQFSWRGSGGHGQRGGRGRAKAGAGNHFFYNSEGNTLQEQQKDVLSNKSIILENPPAEEPKKDYASLPLLAAPPQIGQRIAFKLLELTENYTPEVSDYKEGKIISYDQTTSQVELEVLTSPAVSAEPGKFDLVYHTPDGAEVVEYAVTRSSKITERWSSLIEPRLITESTQAATSSGPA
ncbi:coilin isoform X2 [Erpetoichthys calabaricus]|uniref:coilin isoform X2 n=1 Tax=Erpetoichthys calabaricus TaxID=27687 RepID=UPI002234369A|nr:coilin isoform X2 [Erpetoichthys calabaricus]